MKTKHLWFGLLGASALVGACQVILGIEDTTAGAEDASVGPSSSSSGGGSSGAGPLCPPDRDATATPLPPRSADASPSDDVVLTFAIKTLRVSGPPSFGFDLDGYDTQPDAGAGPRCKTIATELTADGPGGIDNNGFKLLTVTSDSFTFTAEDFVDPVNADIAAGESSILFQVLKYNGQPDDEAVLVGIAAASGTGDAGAPQWDGQDRWTFTNEYIFEPPDSSTPLPPYYPAYVRDNVLTMIVPPVQGKPFRFPLFGTAIPFTRGVLTANIVPPIAPDQAYKLEGAVAAGTLPPVVLYDALRRIKLQGEAAVCNFGGYLCPTLVAGADIPAQGYCDDELPATALCAEVSLTFGFDAVQSVLGPRFDRVLENPPTCPDFDVDAGVCP